MPLAAVYNATACSAPSMACRVRLGKDVKETGQEALERGKQVAQEAAQSAKETAQQSGREHAEQLKQSAQQSAQQVSPRSS